MIRILLVDDHPALRAGLTSVLRMAAGFVPVGAANSAGEAVVLFERLHPDLVLLDYHLPGESSLRLCRYLKGRPVVPTVVFYSAHADVSLAVSVAIAGGDGLVNKDAPAHELLDAVRMAHAGTPVLPAMTESLFRESTQRLSDEDRSIIEMVRDRAGLGDVAGVLGVNEAAAGERIDRILARLERDAIWGA